MATSTHRYTNVHWSGHTFHATYRAVDVTIDPSRNSWADYYAWAYTEGGYPLVFSHGYEGYTFAEVKRMVKALIDEKLAEIVSVA